jgi:protocatechuate 3,4-dioxygenase beta subunit
MAGVRAKTRVLAFVAVTAGFVQLASASARSLAAGSPAARRPNTGIIIGRVIDDDSKAPIASAVVTISPSSGATPQVDPGGARTNASGVFALAQVPVGTFRLTAHKPGYYTARLGSGSTVTMAEGRHVDDAVLSLRRYGSIHGTVVDERGEPIEGAVVRAHSRTQPGPWPAGLSAVTDDSGRYVFQTLRPREYVLGVHSAPIAMQQLALKELSRELRLGSVDWIPPGIGLLTGFVNATRADRDGLLAIGDDVVTHASVALPPRVTREGALVTYETTFYPAARSIDSATPIPLGPGENLGSVDFRLVPVAATPISGVLEATGIPLDRIAVSLLRHDFDSPEPIVASALADAAGRFRLPAVAHGAYRLSVSQRQTVAPTPAPQAGVLTATSRITTPADGSVARPLALTSERTAYASMPIVVGPEPLALHVPVTSGARISGDLAFEGTSARPTPDQLSQFSVQFWAFDNGASNFFSTRVDEGGRFVSPGLPPGRYLLRAILLSSPWRTRSFRAESREFVERPIVIGTRDLEGVSVVLSDRLGTVGGTVRRSDGAPARAVPVLLFTAERDRWTSSIGTIFFYTTTTSQSGQYAFPGRLPGEYHLAALTSEPPENWRMPEWLDTLAASATRVAIRDGKRTDAHLTALDVPEAPARRIRGTASDPVSAVCSDVQERQDLPATPAVARGSRAGSIAGVVVDDRTNEPLGRATVTLRVDGEPSRTTHTDERGAFQFTRLPTGTVRLTASRPGYLRQEHAATRMGGAGIAIVIVGERRLEQPLRLVRGAEVAGRVVDADGSPVPDVLVHALTLRRQHGEQVLDLAEHSGRTAAETDANGRYRIAGLAPGDYLVAVAPGSAASTPARATTEALLRWARARASGAAASAEPPLEAEEGHTTTFHPSALRPIDATTLSVGSGDIRSGVDIAMRRVPMFAVFGQVVLPAGRPPRRASVVVVPSGLYVPSTSVLTIGSGNSASLGGAAWVTPSASGDFRVGRLPGGTYRLIATSVDESSGAVLWAARDVGFPGGDLAPLAITLQPGPTVRGTVSLEESGSQIDLAGVRVRLRGIPLPSTGGVAVTPPAVAVDAHGAFAFAGVFPGRYAVEADGLPPAAALRSVVANGRDATDELVSLDQDDVVLQLTATVRPASLHGRLLDARDLPAPEHFIAIVPRNRELWSSPVRRVRAVRPREDGEFVFNALPPGDYVVAAVTDWPADAQDDLAWLESIARVGVPVTIRDGERASLQLRVSR